MPRIKHKEIADNAEDIPLQIDMFLRLLATWTAEDIGSTYINNS